MNKTRRNNIQHFIDLFLSYQEDIESIQIDEMEALENLPDNLTYSEKAEKMSSCVDSLTYALDSLQDCIDNLYECIEQ